MSISDKSRLYYVNINSNNYYLLKISIGSNMYGRSRLCTAWVKCDDNLMIEPNTKIIELDNNLIEDECLLSQAEKSLVEVLK